MRKVAGLHRWIDALPPGEREAVVGRMKSRRYEAGQSVYLMGEQGHELFRILSGKVRFCTYAESGREVEVGALRPGDCFGELSLIGGLYRTHCTFAVGETELSVLHKRDFDELYEQFPCISRELNKLLVHRLHMAYTVIEDASLLSMRDRLSRLLARLAYSIASGDGKSSATIDGITHEQMARMIGATRQAVTRELKVLEKAQLIEISYGKIEVHDVGELVRRSDQLAGSEPIVPDYSD